MLENATKAISLCTDDDPKENDAYKSIMDNIDMTNSKFVDTLPNNNEEINVMQDNNETDTV